MRQILRFFRAYSIILHDQIEFIAPKNRLQTCFAYCASLFPSIGISLRLLRFDSLIAEASLPAAADWLLREYYRGYEIHNSHICKTIQSVPGAAPPYPTEAEINNCKASLIIANHTGLADALALLTWWGRDDIWIVTRERRLFQSLPALSAKTLSVGTTPGERKELLLRLNLILKNGGHVLLFPAGQIEADPWFQKTKAEKNSGGEQQDLVKPWSALIGYLVEESRREGYEFYIQASVTGNVYGALTRHIAPSLFRLLRLKNREELNKIMAFLTFIFRLGKRQTIRLCPLKIIHSSELKRDFRGKKVITAHVRELFIDAVLTCSRNEAFTIEATARTLKKERLSQAHSATAN